MFDVLMRCRLWDLEEVGFDIALGELHGLLGVAGIVVDVLTPAVADLRMRGGAERRIFRTGGGTCFHPDMNLYERTRCKPLTAEWLKSRHPLQKLIEEAEGFETSVCGRASLLRSERLAERHPEFAMKNVLGDVSQEWLCPGNPDVREYACSLAYDLSENYGLAGLIMGDVRASGGWSALLADEVVESLGAGGAALLDVCFCESCRQGTPLADAAARVAEALLERSFETGEPVGERLKDVIRDHDELARYAQWQHDSLVRLLADMGERTTVPYWLDHGTARVADVEVVEENTRGVIEVKTRRNTPSANTIGLYRGISPFSPSVRVGRAGPALVKFLTDAAEAKLPRVILETFGLYPDSAREVIRQGIRFARRSAK